MSGERVFGVDAEGVTHAERLEQIARTPFSPLVLAEYARVADRIAQAGHRAVLDWGCGLGQMTRLMRDRGLHVSSLDYDPDAHGVETRPLPAFPDLEMLTTPEPVTLPFEDDAFDAALSMGVLEHVADPDASLDELRRVIARGGRLYCHKLPNERSYLERIARRAGLYYHGRFEHDRLYSLASARAIFERHGFEVQELRRINVLPLTPGGGRALTAAAPAIYRLNRGLSRLPGLNTVATNIEVIAAVRG